MSVAEYEKELEKIANGKLSKNMELILNNIRIPSGVVMDYDPNSIHFLNGHFDLKEGRFRLLGDDEFGRKKEHYISNLIPYDWVNTTDWDFFDNIMLQVFSDPFLWDYIKYILGKSLSG